MGADGRGKTCVVLATDDTGDGTPLGIAMRYSTKQLPQFTEWKMMRRGCYVLGLEPSTVNPVGRSILREKGQLPFIDPQSAYIVDIELEVLGDREGLKEAVNEAVALGRGARK